jgi:hypothetical protein
LDLFNEIWIYTINIGAGAVPISINGSLVCHPNVVITEI